MSYIIKNLKTNEKLIFNGYESYKTIFIVPCVSYLFIFLAAFFLGVFEIITTEVLAFLLIIIFISFILGFIAALIRYFTTEYGITDTRVMFKEGVIKRNVEEINLTSIETININQTILGRILNYGSIIISGRGTSKIILKNIDNPIQTRKLIKNS